VDPEQATPLELSLAPEGWAHAIESVLADPRMLRFPCAADRRPAAEAVGA